MQAIRNAIAINLVHRASMKNKKSSLKTQQNKIIKHTTRELSTQSPLHYKKNIRKSVFIIATKTQKAKRNKTKARKQIES